MTRRDVCCQWRLRQIMAENGLFATTDLCHCYASPVDTMPQSPRHKLELATPKHAMLPVHGHDIASDAIPGRVPRGGQNGSRAW